MLTYLAVFLLACGPEEAPEGADGPPATVPTETDTPTPAPTPTPTASPGELSVAVVRNAYPHVVRIEASPAPAGAVVVVCDAGGDEVLVHDLPTAVPHMELVGLLADTAYACTLIDSTTDERAVFEVVTIADDAPATTVTTHDTLLPDHRPYLLVNTNEQCGSDIVPSLRIYDLDGRARWTEHQPFDVNLAVEARYHGDGLVVWGGGYATSHALEYVRLDHIVERTVGHELAPDATMFHHDSKLLDDGTELVLAEVPNTDGATTWLGWRAIATGPVFTGQVDSQQLFDAGARPAGLPGDDTYHANWIDLVDGVLYVSQCFTDEILAVDPTDASLLWRIGPGPDSLQLVDPDGTPLPPDAWPTCQHGLEVDGDQLLIYDNGRYPDRQFSRAMGLTVHPEAGTATVDWVYTEPDWFETAMGDIDDLGDGRVLVHMAHVECWGLFPDQTTVIELDVASGEVVWRLVFDDPMVASYRAERIDACDAMPHMRYCDGVEERLVELGFR
jgi:hypothetical protein